MWLLKISLILVDGLLKVGPGKTKKILEKSLKSHGIFSQKRCMNPEYKVDIIIISSNVTCSPHDRVETLLVCG